MNSEMIFKQVLDCAFEVHKTLGPGLLESTYEECLCYELEKIGLEAQRQVMLPVNYKGIKLDAGYRIDILVEEEIIIELKSVTKLNELHLAQMITYLKLSENHLGLLINFNSKLLKDGIKRVINTNE